MTTRSTDRRWAAAVTVAAGLFAWWEGEAYARRDPDATMTYWVRRALGICPKRRRRFITVPVMWLFCAWLPVHFQWNAIGIPVKR